MEKETSVHGKTPPHIENNIEPWIGIDLDGTLAHYDGWRGKDHIGSPIVKMMDRVKAWIKEGKKIKIYTARAYDPEQIPYIEEWLERYDLGGVEVTNIKDFGMTELWDDRAIRVMRNTGIVCLGMPTIEPPDDLFHYEKPIGEFYCEEGVLKICDMINSSGWAWTVESCEGHDEGSYKPDGHQLLTNKDPFIRLLTHTENMGGLVHTIQSIIDFEKGMFVELYPGMILDMNWCELIVYITGECELDDKRGTLELLAERICNKSHNGRGTIN